MLMLRRFALVAAILVVAGACGGGEPTLGEYVEELTAMMDQAIQEGEALTGQAPGAVLVAESDELSSFTPQDLQAALEQLKRLERDVRQAAEAIEPPEALVDVHRLMFDTRFASALQPLADRAGTAETWEELADTPEMVAYRRAVAVDKQACFEIQAKLDAAAERGVFADTPWIPGELQEVADVVVGCASFPENPEDLYRPPPTS